MHVTLTAVLGRGHCTSVFTWVNPRCVSSDLVLWLLGSKTGSYKLFTGNVESPNLYILQFCYHEISGLRNGLLFSSGPNWINWVWSFQHLRSRESKWSVQVQQHAGLPALCPVFPMLYHALLRSDPWGCKTLHFEMLIPCTSLLLCPSIHDGSHMDRP